MNIFAFSFIGLVIGASVVALALIFMNLVRVASPASRHRGISTLVGGVVGGFCLYAVRTGVDALLNGWSTAAPSSLSDLLWATPFMALGFVPSVLVMDAYFRRRHPPVD